MLSRTCRKPYWLARYVERAEYLARTIDATLRVTALPAAYIGKTNEWDSALLTAGVSASFYRPMMKANEYDVIEFFPRLVNPSSIRNCSKCPARSRSVRTASCRARRWDTINRPGWSSGGRGKGTSSARKCAKLLDFVQETLAAVRWLGATGRPCCATTPTVRGSASVLPSVDAHARILDVKSFGAAAADEHVGGRSTIINGRASAFGSACSPCIGTGSRFARP